MTDKRWFELIGVTDDDIDRGLEEISARIERYVPIRRVDLLPFAAGTFNHHPKNPLRDYVAIAGDLPKHKEIIVLAHELGHVENSLLEPDRFHAAIVQNYLFRGLNREPTDPHLIIEEELEANRRGRAHMKQVAMSLVTQYDVTMEIAMDPYRKKGWHKDRPFAWIKKW